MTLALISTTNNNILAKLICVAGLVVVGDYLFFDLRPGVNIALFMSSLAATLIWTTRRLNGRQIWFSSILFAAVAFYALAENISLLSILLALTGVTTLAMNFELPWYKDALGWTGSGLRFVFSAPGRIFRDIKLVGKIRTRYGKTVMPGGLKSWLVPIGFTSMFAMLFAIANPVIDHFLFSLFNIPDRGFLPVGRLALWSAILLFIWPVFARRMAKSHCKIKAKTGTETDKQNFFQHFFPPQTILRSLVMFNLLFAFQTGLDFTYLWAATELPDDMSYASYAHRGAYPLIATVLLAAFFILVTMYEGAKAENNRSIRLLVFLWVGQNILLTVSSIERLRLYVEAYSLTYMRVAALIWMVLVAVGLGLIIFRIWRNRTNRWLINANILTLTAALFFCAYVNFDSQIAWFNVKHSHQITGKGQFLDFRYIRKLGPQALPAIRWLQSNHHGNRNLETTAQHLEHLVNRSNRDWREMTLRDRRLVNWLANNKAKVQKETNTLSLQGKR